MKVYKHTHPTAHSVSLSWHGSPPPLEKSHVVCHRAPFWDHSSFLYALTIRKGQSVVGLLLYADDSALLISGRPVDETETNLAGELSRVRMWLIGNKLSLHLQVKPKIHKSPLMYFW